MTQENFKKLIDNLEAVKEENIELKKLMILNLTKRDKLEDANKIMSEGLKYISGDHGIKAPELVEFSHIKARLIINQVKEILGE